MNIIATGFEPEPSQPGLAVARANIKVPDWNDASIASEEQRMFIGFRVAEDPAAPTPPVRDGLIAQSFELGGVPPSTTAQEPEAASTGTSVDGAADDDIHEWEIRK